MTLLQKLQQYGQFGDADMPEIKAILVHAEMVASDNINLETQCLCATDVCEGCVHGDCVKLIERIHALVDGKRDVVGDIDDLWSAVNFAHGRLDEGEIDDDTAKYECDTAINAYLGRPPCDPEHINSMFPVEQVDDTKAKWEELIEDGAFVTMTVPVQVALMVVDNEAGDAHASAVFNLEQKLCEDFLEEYGVDEEGAWEINQALSKGGA